METSEQLEFIAAKGWVRVVVENNYEEVKKYWTGETFLISRSTHSTYGPTVYVVRHFI